MSACAAAAHVCTSLVPRLTAATAGCCCCRGWAVAVAGGCGGWCGRVGPAAPRQGQPQRCRAYKPASIHLIIPAVPGVAGKADEHWLGGDNSGYQPARWGATAPAAPWRPRPSPPTSAAAAASAAPAAARTTGSCPASRWIAVAEPVWTRRGQPRGKGPREALQPSYRLDCRSRLLQAMSKAFRGPETSRSSALDTPIRASLGRGTLAGWYPGGLNFLKNHTEIHGRRVCTSRISRPRANPEPWPMRMVLAGRGARGVLPPPAAAARPPRGPWEAREPFTSHEPLGAPRGGA